MNRAALPDEEVVRTSQETGGEDCFAELFARHRQKVYSACRRFFADSAMAEDAAREAFLRGYRNIQSLHGGDFLGWLSYQETAARTGLSIEAVKSRLQNGRRMLSLRMEGVLY